MAIKVPAKVFEGLNCVRDSGKTNMLNLKTVAKIAYDIGFVECANWVYDNVSLYVVGVFEGFEREKLTDDNKRTD